MITYATKNKKDCHFVLHNLLNIFNTKLNIHKIYNYNILKIVTDLNVFLQARIAQNDQLIISTDVWIIKNNYS